jgi:hypothetical protein
LPIRLTPKSVAVFLLKFAVLYGVAFSVYWTPGVFRTVHRAFIDAAGAVLAVVQPDVSYRIYVHADRTIHVSSAVRDFSKDFDIPGDYGINLLVLLALVLASPGLAWRVRGAGLVAGTAVIAVVNTWMMLGTIWNFEARYAELQPHLPSGAVLLAGRLANQFSPTGGIYMLPIFLWGFVLLSRLSGGGARGSARVGRNEPCPCGSGRKYKACCGA